ncbi:hypothetical protein BDR26DRAFT_858696 [Obelidium mucronatum]|nr:hypothetical protein BDR26DRAFT_858696 [Obelidium mucronatum]
MANVTSTTAYIPQSTQTTDIFVADYFLNVPIYLLGMLMNGAVLLTLIRNREHLMQERMHTIMAYIIGATFAWSAFSATKYLLWLVHASDLFYRLSAFLSSLAMVLLFVLNLLLSIERFIIVRSLTQKRSIRRGATIAVWCFTCMILLINMGVFATSPSINTVTPEYPLQKKVWIATMATSFVIVTTAIIALYISTFIYSAYYIKRMDASLFQIPSASVQWQLFWNCVAMFGSLVVSYGPQMMLVIGAQFYVKGISDENKRVMRVVAHTALALDTVWTPLLAVYFMPQVRRKIFSIFNTSCSENFADEGCSVSELSGSEFGKNPESLKQEWSHCPENK